MRSAYSLLFLCLASVVAAAAADQAPLKPDKKVPVKMNCYMDEGSTAVQCECTPCKPDPDEKKCPGGKCPPDEEDPKKKCPGGKCPPDDGEDDPKKKCPGGKCPPDDGDDSKKKKKKKCPWCPEDEDGDDPEKKCPGGKCPPDGNDDDDPKKKCPGGKCPPDDDDSKKKCPGGKCPPDDGDDDPKKKCPPGCVCPTKCPAAETVTVTATKTVTVEVPGPSGKSDPDCPSPDSAWPLRRMWNAAWQDHYYETDGRLVAYAGTLGFVEEYPVGRVFLSEVAGTVPLWRCFWPLTLDHFYTADEAEFRAAQAKGCEAFPEPGSIGFLYKTQKCNSLPMYRLYSEQWKDHLYTSDSAERDNLVKTGLYKDEGITGYVLPNWGPGGPGT